MFSETGDRVCSRARVFRVSVSHTQKMSSFHQLAECHDRLLEFIRAFHKRFAEFSFAEGLQDVKFLDPAFDNGQMFQRLFGTRIDFVLRIEDGVAFPHPCAQAQEWWFNGHLLCDTVSQPWNPRVADALVVMMKTVTMPHNSPPLIVNPRDFPFCKADGKVPWTFLEAPLPSEHKEKMQKPLSFYGGQKWTDILMPLPEHWNVWKECESLRCIPRDSGLSTGVFRGTFTGRFLDDRNVRMQLAKFSKQHPGVLDAGFSKWTNRLRVVTFVPESSTLVIEAPPSVDVSLLRPEMSREQQCKHDVLVYAPGHVGSSRLAWQLCSGSAVLMVDDPSCAAPDMWFMSEKFQSNIVRFSEGVFQASNGIAFACTPSDVLQALEALKRSPDLLSRVRASCLHWAEQMFSQLSVQKHLQQACLDSVTIIHE